MVPSEPTLQRRVSPLGITMYGIGNILGAGIYALIGDVIGITGNFSWFAFLCAAGLGAITGLSYAELSTMYPQSAAEFVYAERAFKKPLVSFLLGWIIIFAGMFASATVALSFGQYLTVLLGLTDPLFPLLSAIILIIILSLVNYRGIRESTWTNIVFTIIEAGGLILLIVIGIPFLGTVDYLQLPMNASITAVPAAVTLIFFAYIGFEDIANMAEEVADPQRTLPRAILVALLITTVLYTLVALAVVSIVPAEQIAASSAPLNTVALAVLGAPGGFAMTLIALFATANTVLITLIVTSRMIYGMARDDALPQRLAKLSTKRQTPQNGILLTLLIAVGLLFLGNLSLIANATVIGVLLTFLLVNLSVIALRRRDPDTPRPFMIKPSVRHVPIPALVGVIICGALLFTFDLVIVGIQAGVLIIGGVVYAIIRYAKKRRQSAPIPVPFSRENVLKWLAHMFLVHPQMDIKVA